MLLRWGVGLVCSLVGLVCWSAAQAAVFETPEAFMQGHTFPAEVDREKLLGALNDAGQNWLELAHALDDVLARYPDPQQSATASASVAWLIVNAPHLDRLELSRDMLLSTVDWSMATAEERGYDPRSEFFRRYLLNYRIDDEPVTDWRAGMSKCDLCTLEGISAPAEGSDALTMAKYALQQVALGFNVRERGFFGPESDPLSVFRARSGTKAELSLLVAAKLRAVGFATRFVSDNASSTSWVEVFTGDPLSYQAEAWTPLYPLAMERSGDPSAAAELCGGRISIVTAGDAFGREQVTARYTPTGAVQLSFTRGGLVVPKFESYTITCWHNGQYVALDDLAYPISAMDYPLDSNAETAADAMQQRFHLGAPGDYRLEAGVRYPGGVTDVHLLPFHIEPDSQQTLTMALDPPADLPMMALVEREVQAQPDAAGRWLYLVMDGSEPSIRAKALLDGLGIEGLHYVVADLVDPTKTVPEMVEYLQLKPDDPKPVVVVVVDGVTKLYRRGYDLNIADWVRRALEVQQ